MTHERWTPAEDDRLRAMWPDQKMTLRVIGDAIGRTHWAIKRRAEHLELGRKTKRRETDFNHSPMTRCIREHWGKLSVQEIAVLAGSTPSAVRARASVLNLPPLEPGVKHGPMPKPDKPKGIPPEWPGIAEAIGATEAELRLIRGMVREGILRAGE